MKENLTINDFKNMQRYVEQLIEDLEQAAKHPPVKPFIEPPPHIADDEVVSELALIPYKTIEEWTGIKQIAFPSIFKLSDNQIKLLNAAIFKVLESLHIELIDKPKFLPEEVLYDILTDYWDDFVQYLPSSGFDWELCTGDPDTCPYGHFCDCMDELPEDDMQIEENDENNALPF